MRWLKRVIHSASLSIRTSSFRLFFYSSFLYLKNSILTFLYLAKMPRQQYSKIALWNQIEYQMYWRNPKTFGDILKNMLKVSITYKCNTECRYCFARGLIDEFPADMSIDNFYRLVEWGKRNGYDNISFVGGESTIHRDFTEMLKICYRNQIFVQINTNNLFSCRIVSALNRHWIFSVIINYMLRGLNSDQKRIFRENLGMLNAKKIPFGFSYILSYENEDWQEITKDIKRYNPCYVWACLPVPGFSGQTSCDELINNLKPLLEKIYKLLDICIKLNVPFTIFRPLPSCMFSQAEWHRLRKFFPFFAFTRCFLGYRGNYANMTLVNPDLSIFPCSSVFIKGPNILSFRDKSQISDFYKKTVKQLASEPLAELCRNCEKHTRFIDSFEKDFKQADYFDGGMCQGGCLNFRNKTPSSCRLPA